jgi:hypothetical protein
MMGVENAKQRRFHVLNAHRRSMDAPRGLIPFRNTPLGTEHFRSALKNYSLNAVIASLVVFAVLFWFTHIVVVLSIIVTISAIIMLPLKKNSDIPLAINLNHPFMESNAVAGSEIMVKFAQEWIDPGVNRLKLVKDPLTGWNVHRQDDNMSLLSSWDTNLGTKVLNRKLTIINQAISLNNAINESNDEFEDARVREEQESTLLEREWLPEDEIEVQGPLSRMFSPD